VKARERELHLRLDSRRAYDVASRRVVGDVVEQRRLPHAGFAADDESPALAVANCLNEPVNYVAFSPSAEQLHGAPPERELVPSPE
jgi:hypothetical protein